MNKDDDLERKLKELKKKKADFEQIAADMAVEYEALKRDIQSISDKLGYFFGDVNISDHALVRFMERKHKIPVEEYRNEIADEVKKCTSIDEARARGFRVKGHTVTTYINR